MKSEGSFLAFLKKGKTAVRAAVILAAGIILILLGGFFGKSEGEDAPSAEEELAEICTMTEGVGRARVVMTYGEEGEVYAVAVLCDGAENPAVRARIVKLVGSLYGIGANRISVLKINE